MDIITSIPILGYLLMPSMGSYSTGLSLLFFYMTWSTLVLSQSPLKVEVVGSLAVRLLFTLAPSILFLTFDSALPSLAVGIKRQGASGLPTRTGGVAGARKVAGTPEWYRVVALSIFNICLAVAIQAGVEVLCTEVFQIRSVLKVSTTLPLPWSMAKDIAISLLVREVWQYWIHRYLHSASAPKNIAKMHASYYHSVRSPYSFAAHYEHPLLYLLWRFVPLYIPAVTFRLHVLTYFVLLSLVSLEETLALSGYNIVPGIMLGGIARRQDLHNQSRGKGNFAPWGILDWVHETSIGPDVVDDMKDEAEKHHVKERGNKALNNAKESGKAGISAWNSRRRSSRKA